MQKYYTIYDHANWRMGLVESKNTFASQDSEKGETNILDKIQKEAQEAEKADAKPAAKAAPAVNVTANTTVAQANATANATLSEVAKAPEATPEATPFTETKKQLSALGTEYDDGTSDI